MTKGGKQEVAAVGHNSYAGTRFNAVKHAVLSRFTVLPWEDATEYGELVRPRSTWSRSWPAPCGRRWVRPWP